MAKEQIQGEIPAIYLDTHEHHTPIVPVLIAPPNPSTTSPNPIPEIPMEDSFQGPDGAYTLGWVFFRPSVSPTFVGQTHPSRISFLRCLHSKPLCRGGRRPPPKEKEPPPPEEEEPPSQEEEQVEEIPEEKEQETSIPDMPAKEEPLPEKEPAKEKEPEKKGKSRLRGIGHFIRKVLADDEVPREDSSPAESYSEKDKANKHAPIVFDPLIPNEYVVFNVGKSLQMRDFRRPDQSVIWEQRYHSNPRCHAFDTIKSSEDGFRLLVGFGSGDIMLTDPLCLTESVFFNRDGVVCPAGVSKLLWVSENDFIASFVNGVILGMDASVSEEFDTSLEEGKRHKTKPSKRNPSFFWKISSCAITDMALSLSKTRLACTGDDGWLRVMDWPSGKALMRFRSYYGAFLCASWSPDGNFIATGGEDDVVIIYSMRDGVASARLEGHDSFVASVAWDSWETQPEEERYRLASAGQDGKLLMWEFSRDTITRPRTFTATSEGGVVKELGGEVVVPALKRCELFRVEALSSATIHNVPLTTVTCLQDVIVTVCEQGFVKVWKRPTVME